MEVLIQEITTGCMVVLPMILLLAIIFNVIKSHSIAAITLIWSILFAFVYLSTLLNSVHSSLKSYVLWYEMLKGFNLDAWLCLSYFGLIIIAAMKTVSRMIEKSKYESKTSLSHTQKSTR